MYGRKKGRVEEWENRLSRYLQGARAGRPLEGAKEGHEPEIMAIEMLLMHRKMVCKSSQEGSRPMIAEKL